MVRQDHHAQVLPTKPHISGQYRAKGAVNSSHNALRLKENAESRNIVTQAAAR
jgi:hypothetical protein